jgi:hypothetical protein
LKVKDVEEVDDDDDDDDEDDDNREYTEAEANTVSQCVRLMTTGQDLLKIALQCMTTVGDRLLAGEEDQSSDAKDQCYRWISQLTQCGQLLENDCIDLGAELYPPVETDVVLCGYTTDPSSASTLQTLYLRFYNIQTLTLHLLVDAKLYRLYDATAQGKIQSIVQKLKEL